MDIKATITAKGSIFEGKAPEIFYREIAAAMYEATLLLEGEVKKRTPQGVFGAQGGLVSTIHGEVQGKGTPVQKGIIGHQSKYGDVIEKGRSAGEKMPPKGSLLRWMEVKGIHMRDVGSIQEALAMAHYRKRKKVRSIQEALIVARNRDRLEFLIRRNIGREGFPGVKMFERAFDENMGRLQEIFDKYGFQIAKALDAE